MLSACSKGWGWLQRSWKGTEGEPAQQAQLISGAGSKGLSPSRARDKGSLGWCLAVLSAGLENPNASRFPVWSRRNELSPCSSRTRWGFPDPIPERFEMPTPSTSPCCQRLALCPGGALNSWNVVFFLKSELGGVSGVPMVWNVWAWLVPESPGHCSCQAHFPGNSQHRVRDCSTDSSLPHSPVHLLPYP